MTRLLVSVRDSEEAAAAVAAGAHLIDVKEPRRGALGAADYGTIAHVVHAVGGRVPVSVALGELFAGEASDFAPPELIPPGVSFAKFGLAQAQAHRNWFDVWRERLALLPPSVQPVAVAYADWQTAAAPVPAEVLEHGARLGCAALLVDTFDKSRGALFDWLRPPFLAQLIEQARRANLLVVLAGSLSIETLPQAAELAPDFVAVRGAACARGRAGRLSGTRVRRLVELLQTPENAGV